MKAFHIIHQDGDHTPLYFIYKSITQLMQFKEKVQ